MLPPTRITTLLVKQANPLLSLAHQLIPHRLEHYAVLMILNRLAHDFLINGELNFLENKIARVSITDIDIDWCFTLSDHESDKDKKLKILESNPGEVDVVFSGTLSAMILMASQKMDPDTLFFNRQLTISGDTELGLEIKNLIDQFDIGLLNRPMKQVLDIWSNTLLEA